ncbi:Protein CBG26326 [Caenorhabditis briggsae]|uniref:Protein CBG26326 n=1 Tax=Caenorhabditis briggsae TaxID=6238 RepID=B6IG98_CAEBR|nr:Protein CBG26326 [Caenorhabditis briggsae]CAR98928.1 Protein CBG26326 [Caenorhabditis briggsae]
MNSSYTQQSKVIQQAVQHVSESISILINSILIYIIIKKSPSKLGPYKYLMTFISVFEILYSVTDFLVSPIFYSYGPALIVIVNLNESFFGKAVSYIFLCKF